MNLINSRNNLQNGKNKVLMFKNLSSEITHYKCCFVIMLIIIILEVPSSKKYKSMKAIKLAEKYLICIVLILVALIQLYHSQFDRLTPWKGGGFGMFSTNKRANIVAVGYKSDGDSIVIRVVASKYDIPISKNFLTTVKNFPTNKRLKRLGSMILSTHLKPEKIQIPQNIDSLSAVEAEQNQEFYSTTYFPKYYQSDVIAQNEDAVKVDKVKIILYETDFLEEGYLYTKKYIDEIEIEKVTQNQLSYGS